MSDADANKTHNHSFICAVIKLFTYSLMLTYLLTHSLTRSLLELSLETQPRDSKFSSQLVLLMQKEENMLRNDSLSPASTVGTSQLLPHFLTYSQFFTLLHNQLQTIY